jgi:FkbM family methyltransferase
MLLSFNSLIKQYHINITGVIHVGGHIGDELHEYKINGVENIIIFEPQSHCFEKLSIKAREVDLPAKLVNKALGNKNGRIDMTSDPTGLCGSILKPKLHLELSPDVLFSETLNVEISKLDDEIPENHTYNFLNMDTQGYELEVLKGGVKTLEKIDYIYTEVNQAEVYENNAMIGELDEFLNDYDMERVATGWHGSQTWGDALYIKRGLV